MAPVEQRRARTGNPDASHPARRHRRHARQQPPCVGASPACAWRGPHVHETSSGSVWPPGAARPHAPGGCRRVRSTSCRGRSGCKGSPVYGIARTGTGGLSPLGPPVGAECAGRSRPGAPHCGGTVLYWHVKGAARSISLAGDEDRCRARLLRLGCVVQRARLRRGEHAPAHSRRLAARARRGQVTRPQGKPVDGPFGVRDLPTAPRRLAFGLTRCACRTADLESEKKRGPDTPSAGNRRLAVR
jgi:hypothetical protein